MAIDINVRITLAQGESYTPYENGILAAVAGGTAPAPTVDTPVVNVQQAAAAPEAEPAAPAAPKRTRRTKAQIEADELAAAKAQAEAAEDEEAETAPEPEPEDDLLGTDPEPVVEYTTADAVAKATQVLADGGTANVKAALAAAGVKRVSELKGAAIAGFIAALEG